MDKLQEIKKRIEDIQTKSLVASDMKAFIALVLKVVTEKEKNFDTLSKENLATIQEAVNYIDKEHSKLKEDVNRETSESKKEFNEIVAELKNLIAKVKTIKPVDGKNGKDGTDGKDGKDGKDGSPDKPLQIKDKLETLKKDERLDISALKGLEKREGLLTDSIINRAIGIVDQRTSFLINKVSTLRADVDAIETNDIDGSGTANELAYWVDSETLGSLATATYPSLSELAYLKTGALTSGSILFFNGTTIAQDNANLFWDDTNNRLGIGTTSPAAKLHVSDAYSAPTGGLDSNIDFILSNTGAWTGLQLLGKNDSGVFIDFGDTDDANVGQILYSHASNYMSFKTGASERLRIDSSGNVGIGTTSPVRPLQVIGDVVFGSIGTHTGGIGSNRDLVIGATTPTTSYVTAELLMNMPTDQGIIGRYLFANSDGTTRTYVASIDAIASGTLRTSADLAFKTGNAGAAVERMRIDKTGKVGINFTNPVAKLQVQHAATTTIGTNMGIWVSEAVGAVNTVHQIGFGYNDGSPQTYAPAVIGGIEISSAGSTNEAIFFATRSATTDIAPTERMRIDQTGNVGIGVTDPDEKLEVNGASHFGNRLDIYPGGNAVKMAIIGARGDIGAGAPNANDLVIKQMVDGNNIVLQTYDGVVMTLLDGGNVGIGTTAPGYALDVQSGAINTLNTYRVGGQASMGLSGNEIRLGTTNNYNLNFYAGSGVSATSRMWIDYTTGNVGIRTTTPGANLDVKSSGGDNYAIRVLTSGSANQIFGVYQDSSGNGHLYVRNSVATARIALASDDGSVYADVLRLGYSGTAAKITTVDTNEDLTIDPAGTGRIIMQGNVGIGTTSPSSKLDVTTAGLGVTQTTSSGLALVNTTAAAVGAQQISPALRWSGFGWKTDATAASQAVDFRSYAVPVQGSANPTGYLTFEGSINGGAYAESMRLTDSGGVVVPNSLSIWSGSPIDWYSDTGTTQVGQLYSDTSGIYTFWNPATTSGLLSFTSLATDDKTFTFPNFTGTLATAKSGRATAQTAANASVNTYTLDATDASFMVSANVLVTTSSAENFTVTVAYTDEGNTARTITLNFQLLAGTIGTAINFANGAVPYEGIPVHIRAKASTAITIATTGTFTGATYNVEGVITQIN